jgi:23S rRNA pseudouridine2604 synthase
MSTLFPIRINKYLAERGYATRRGADTLIASGRVLINGTPAVIGQKVAERDVVEVAARGGADKRHQYILYYKPAGILTHAEADTETTDVLRYAKKKNGITGLFPIGRLDKETEGLIILTNDGRLTRAFASHPSFAEQEYEVTVDKRVTGTFLNRLTKGVRLDGYMTKPAHAERMPNDHVFTIALSEGRKHHIRRMCAPFGYAVTKLTRTRIGPLKLEALTPGTFHELTAKEITALHAQLGFK